MKLRTLSTITLLLLSHSFYAASSQESGGRSCPVITVSCPESATGGPLTYKVNIRGGDPFVTPTYKWTASAGKIIGGQGTQAVQVDGSGSSYITVTVEVGGYGPSCKTMASCSWIVENGVPSRKVDEYGGLSFADEQARLDQVVAELEREPTAQLYILVYAGRSASKGDSKSRGERAKTYLVKEHDIEEGRVVVVDGGHREEQAVEVFVVPVGADPPKVTPTVKTQNPDVLGAKSRSRKVRP